MKNDIINALANGKEVTLHEQRITVSITDANGVTTTSSPTAGYVIFDPDSGSQAWMIEGGQNGAAVVIGYILTILRILALVLLLLSAPAIILQAIALINFILGIVSVLITCGASGNYGAIIPLIWASLFVSALSLEVSRAFTGLMSGLMGMFTGLSGGLEVYVGRSLAWPN
ncbi:hypothetical protein [Parvibium lacunae]|uniref:hypothetical protein n=1 Tax=Parvibium lacunae TaxID=1888893 RepID=UPI0011C04146|nr:hypothetical protein [Parvibium lacunae]